MGKIKDRRFKLHQSALPKTSSSASEVNASNYSQQLMPLVPPTDNIFSGINIDLSVVKKLDVDFDARSISGRSHREIKTEEQHLPKKEKLRRRHERFMQKLDLIQQMKKDMKERRKRKKTAVVGDMVPLLEALPSPVKTEVKKKTKKPIARASMKARKKQREHLKDMKHFNQVLNDKVFRADPVKAITSFLKQKVAAERNDLNL